MCYVAPGVLSCFSLPLPGRARVYRALSNLVRVCEAMFKCAELVVDLESELEETTADEDEHEELLKDAVRRSAGIEG